MHENALVSENLVYWLDSANILTTLGKGPREFQDGAKHSQWAGGLNTPTFLTKRWRQSLRDCYSNEAKTLENVCSFAVILKLRDSSREQRLGFNQQSQQVVCVVQPPTARHSSLLLLAGGHWRGNWTIIAWVATCTVWLEDLNTSRGRSSW